MEDFHKECVEIVTHTLNSLESEVTRSIPSWFVTGMDSILETFAALRSDLYENNNSYSHSVHTEKLAYTCYETAKIIFKSVPDSLSHVKFWLEKCSDCIRVSEAQNLVYSSIDKETLKLDVSEFLRNISEIRNSQSGIQSKEDIHGNLLMCLALLQFDISVLPFDHKNAWQSESFHLLSIVFEIIQNSEVQSQHAMSYKKMTNQYLNDNQTKTDYVAPEAIIEETVKSELQRGECNLDKVIVAVCEKLNILGEIDPIDKSFITNLYMSNLLREYFLRADEGMTLLCKDNLTDEKILSVLNKIEQLTGLESIPCIDPFKNFKHAKLISLYANKFDKKEVHKQLQQFRYRIVQRILKDGNQIKQEIDFVKRVDDCFTCIKHHGWFLDESLLSSWFEGKPIAWESVLNACTQLKARNKTEEGCLTALSTAVGALKERKDFKLKLPLRKIISSAKTGSAETVNVIKLKGSRKVIEVAGQFIWLSRVLGEINTKLSHDKCIQEVRFVGGKVMHVDADVVWHGINVGVSIPNLFIEELRSWNLSGRNGDQEFTSDAESEMEGEHGSPGESGGNVVINVKTIVNAQLLTITSNGGKGTNGQNGGKGLDGQDGVGMTLEYFKEHLPHASSGSEYLENFATTMTNIKGVSHVDFKSPTYEDGITNVGAGHQITFFFGMHFRYQSLCLVKGTKGKGGTSGMDGGLGGEGGFPGSLNSSYLGINFVATKGYDGESGKRGTDGFNGKDGWDIGYIDKEYGIFVKYPIYYGENEDSKLELVSHLKPGNSKKKANRVYCEEDELWYSIEPICSEYTKSMQYQNTNTCRQQRTRKQHARATRKNNVSATKTASSYYKADEGFDENYLNRLETGLTSVQEKGLSIIENIRLSEEVQFSHKSTTKATWSATVYLKSKHVGNKTAQKSLTSKLQRQFNNVPVKQLNFHIFWEQLLKGDSKALREFQTWLFDFSQIFQIAQNLELRELLPSKLLHQKYLSAFYFEVAKTISADSNFFGYYQKKVSDEFAVDPRLYLAETNEKFILGEDSSSNQSKFEFACEENADAAADIFISHAEKQSIEWKVCLKLFCSEVQFKSHENDVVDKFVVEYSKFRTSVLHDKNVLIKKIDSLLTAKDNVFPWIFAKMLKLGRTNSEGLLQFFEKILNQKMFVEFKDLYDKLDENFTKEFDFDGYFKIAEKGLITSAVVTYIKNSRTDSKVYKEIIVRDSSAFIRVYSMSNEDDTLNDELVFDDFGDHNSSNVLYLLKNFSSQLNLLKVNRTLKALQVKRKIMGRVLKQILSVTKYLEFENLLVLQPNSFVSNINKVNYKYVNPGPEGNTSYQNTYYWYSLISIHWKKEHHYIKQIQAFFPTSCKLVPLLEKLRSSFLGPNLILHQIYSRLQSEGCHISDSTLEFVVSSVLKWKTSCPPCIKIVTWILASYPQNNWADEVFILQLEDFLSEEMSCEQKTTWREILSLLGNKEFYIYIILKLDKINERKETVLKDIENIVKGLGKLMNEAAILDDLKLEHLNHWMYTIQRQFWVEQVNSLLNVKDEEIDEVVFYLSAMQNLHGLSKTEKLYQCAKNAKPSKVLNWLERFYCNESIVQNTSEEDVPSLKLENIEWNQNSDGDRDSETLLKMIWKCSNTCSEFKRDILPSLGVDVANMMKFDKVNDLKSWAQSANSSTTIEHALSMVDFAVLNVKGYCLRDTQKIAILGLLKSERNTLAQVSTGEGKTLIVFACAVIKVVLVKKTVDIITSSSVLAKRDAEINSELYSQFGISVGHNCSEDLEERKKSYAENQVIYSDLSSLQRDYLLNQTQGKNVLGSRGLNCVIADEVDSMLLDKGNNTLYLSHFIPLLEKLDTLYIFIWKTLVVKNSMEHYGAPDIIQSIKRRVWSDLYGLIEKSQLTTLGTEFAGMEEKMWESLTSSNVIDNQGRLQIHLNANSIENLQLPLDGYPKFEPRIKFLLTQTVSRDQFISVPICLLGFIDLHIESFIKSALAALVMENKVDYVVDTNSEDLFPTVIILNKDTGTDERNAQWDEALHQFLLLKHGCTLSPQTLKSVFISNVSFFKRYKDVYGLSGTLGSERERDLLKVIHNVQMFTVPTSKPKKFKEKPPLARSNEKEWEQSIINVANDYCENKGRSVLIICETVKQVERFYELFERELTDISVKPYSRDYEEFEFGNKKELPPNYIIISTNLAGRGTDIKLSKELMEAGGLHVIQTNIPSNIRIEQQAFGRAGRCGEAGSGQLIVISSNVYRQRLEQIEAEVQRLTEVKSDYEGRIQSEENAFEQFFEVYQSCQKKMVGKEKQLQDIVLTSLLDQWAFWLDRNAEKLITHPSEIEEFLKRLQGLKADSYEDWLNGDIIRLTSLGKYLACKGKHSQANLLFDIVINSDPTQAAFAHYYKAYSLGKANSEIPFQIKNELKKELLLAKRLFSESQERIFVLSGLMANLKQRNASFVQIKAYDTQQENIASIYSLFIQSCDDILGIDVTPECFENDTVNQVIAQKLYTDLLDRKVLSKPSFNVTQTEAIKEVSQEYEIPNSNLIRLIEESKGDPFLFHKKMKAMNVCPNREHFWKSMVKSGVFLNEEVFVSFCFTELKEVDPELSTKLKDLKTTGFTKKDIILYPEVLHSSTEKDIVTFKKSVFKEKCGLKYKSLKNLLKFNNSANICATQVQNCNQLDHFDSLKKSDLENIGIPDKDQTGILKLLVQKDILKMTGKRFRLLVSFSKIKEIDLESFHIYKSSIVSLLHNQFAYRGALEELKDPQSNQGYQIKLYPLRSSQLYFDLKDRQVFMGCTLKIIDTIELDDTLLKFPEPTHSVPQPVVSLYQKLSGDSTARKSIATALLRTVGSIDKFGLRNLQDQVKTPETLSFEILGFDQLLIIEDEKYNMKLIGNCLAVVTLGLCQIVIGLAISNLLHFPTVGNCFIEEGKNDIMFSYSSFCSGNFSWKNYREHKMQSIKLLASKAIGIATDKAKDLITDFTGNNEAHLNKIIGRNGVSQMREITSKLTVGGIAGAKQIVKSALQSVENAVVLSLKNERVHQIVQNCFQDVCSQVASNLNGEIRNAVSNHEISFAIDQVVKQLGRDKGMSLIERESEKLFAENTSGSIITIFSRLKYAFFSSIEDSGEIINGSSGNVTTDLKYLGGVLLEAGELAERGKETLTATRLFLRSIENEINKKLDGKQDKVNEISAEELEKFKTEVTDYWQQFLEKEVGKLLSNVLKSPLLQYVSNNCVQGLNNGVKQRYAAIMAGIDNDQVQEANVKYKKTQQSMNDEPFPSEEVERKLKWDYEKSLMNIFMKTRSPKVFIEIVLEEIPLNLTCIQPCLNLVQQYLVNKQGLRDIQLNIIVTAENGFSQSFSSSSANDNTQFVKVQLSLKDGHFRLLGGTSNSSQSCRGHNSLLDSLKSSLGIDTSVEEFRQYLSSEILEESKLEEFITRGWRPFQVKKRMLSDSELGFSRDFLPHPAGAGDKIKMPPAQTPSGVVIFSNPPVTLPPPETTRNHPNPTFPPPKKNCKKRSPCLHLCPKFLFKNSKKPEIDDLKE